MELQANESIKVQFKPIEVESSSLCQTVTKYTFFPDGYKLLDGTELCRKFGGQRVDVSTKAKFNKVVAFLGNIIDDKAPHHALKIPQ